MKISISDKRIIGETIDLHVTFDMEDGTPVSSFPFIFNGQLDTTDTIKKALAEKALFLEQTKKVYDLLDSLKNKEGYVDITTELADLKTSLGISEESIKTP